MMGFPTVTRPRPDLYAGAAAGLALGVYVTSAPLLGGPVGMPGEAVRYLLFTGTLLAAGTGAVFRRRGRARPYGARWSARWAVAACVLAAAAPLTGSPMVFASLLVVAAGLAGGALGLYRPNHAWHAACLAGAGAAGAGAARSAQSPHVACALMCALAALLLIPACRPAAPDDAGQSPPLRGPAGAVGAAVFGSLFAVSSLVVFRWELLGAAGVRPLAHAALLAAALTSALAVAGRRGPAGGTALRTLLLPAGLTAAVTACASAARPGQLTLALAAVLTCGAAAAVGGRAPVTRSAGLPIASLLGGAAAMTAIAFSGRLLGGPDTLTAIGMAPVMAALLPWVRRGRRRGAAPDEDDRRSERHALTARGLVVRGAGRAPVRGLDLALPPGAITYLTDALPGRRAGSVLAVLAGVRKADGGTWRLRGHDVSRVGPEARWDLGLSAFVDPADATRPGALPPGHPAGSVTDAVAAATGRLGHERAAELTAAAHAAFPFLLAKGPASCASLGTDERCLLGLAQTFMTQPAVLLLDLTGAGCEQLATDPAVTAVLGHITDRGTAVLVAAPASQPVPGQRTIVLRVPAGSGTTFLRRNRKASP
ncbi:hypothetical protein OHA37_00290 [Streptomyces sp. NBC_00335]|uniref:hypothetical protein n=1 Tax=unclassified Streptomyces TaxID=2593676 RepID=UPI00224D1CB9|nr:MULTISPECIES: hypothetical protein [unclassified Streptomyces]MCX5410206.1 hypothetical protein [Streptomyces sp. NBC_00086]